MDFQLVIMVYFSVRHMRDLKIDHGRPERMAIFTSIGLFFPG